MNVSSDSMHESHTKMKWVQVQSFFLYYSFKNNIAYSKCQFYYLFLSAHTALHSSKVYPFSPQVNGLWHNLPLNLENGKIRAYQHGSKVIFETDFGIELSYDLVYSLVVTVPGNYKARLSGLCGNYNGEKKDDYQLPDKTTAPDVISFAASWKLPITKEKCDDGCGNPGNNCSVCDNKKKKVLESSFYCGFLKSSPALSHCFPVISPDIYFNNCVLDVCSSLGDLRILCQSIQSYVSACQMADVIIKEWRTETFCRK